MIDIVALLAISAALLFRAVYELNQKEARKLAGLRLDAAIRRSK